MITIKDQKKQNYIDLIYENHQDHILRFWNSLSEIERDSFIKQISKIDFKLMNKLIQEATVDKQSSTYYKNIALHNTLFTRCILLSFDRKISSILISLFYSK